MRAILMGTDNETYGGPEVLTLADTPAPVPGPGQILVRVTACGVNGPDVVQRRGRYPAPEGASPILGLEMSGEVVALGAGEAKGRWSEGDRVCGLTNGGAYAELVAVDAAHCLPIPEGMSEEDAAGLCETFFTVWSNLFHAANGWTMPKGGLLLVHGGGGGIGSTAIQLGKACGLRVFATASAAKLEFCRDLGADRVIDYAQEDFTAIVREAGGADAILDIVGGEYVARNIKAARLDARIVQLAFNAGSRIEVDLMPMMLKRLVLTGSTLRPRPPEFKAEVARALESEVWPLFTPTEGGNPVLRPVTHAALPLEEATKAHQMLESAAHQGKILLQP